MRLQAGSPRCLVAVDLAQGSGFGGGTGNSPRQTSMTEVVTGWLSCEGGEIGRTNTFLVWREEKREKGPGS